MSSVMDSLTQGPRKAINPWFVAAAAVIPTLIGSMDTTIVGVARPYIAGGLSAPAVDDEWVMTSYLGGRSPSFFRSPGWLSAHFGRRNYFLLVDCRLHH